MQTNPLFSPAYALEHLGFHKQFENPTLNEIVPRVVALAAPFFYCLQVVAYLVFGLMDLALAVLGGSPGILCQYAYVHTIDSIRNLVSSILEIPEKLLFGSHHRPNYCEDPKRYVRKDLSEVIGLI